MALSGAGGAWYHNRTEPYDTATYGLHNVYSMAASLNMDHVPFLDPAAQSPGLFGMVGVAAGFNPGQWLSWDHSSPGFYNGFIHRRSDDAFLIAQFIANVPPANAWNHVAVTNDGSNLRAYLNGNLEQTLTVGGSLAGKAFDMFPFAFGLVLDDGTLYGAQQSGMQLAEFAVWNSVLDGAEIVSLNHGLRPNRVRRASLVHYSPFVRNLGENRMGRQLVKQAGSDTYSGHPRTLG